jgi:sugar phosphate permease
MTEPGRSPPAALPSLAITLAIQALASAAVIAPTVVAQDITRRLAVPPAAVGVYIAIVYLGAMLSSVLGGQVVAQRGAIRTSQWALCLCAIGLGLISVGSTSIAALGAFVLGLGYGPITPASSQILARTTPAHRMGLVFSLKQTGVPLGGVIAGFAVPPLALGSGWPAALLGIGAAAVLCAGGAQTLRASLDTGLSPGARSAGVAALIEPLRMIWSAPRLRTIAACSFVFSAVQVCVTAYAVSYLTGQLRWSLVAAGAALSASQGAGVVGRVLWGWIADRGPGARLMLGVLCAMMMACGLVMPLWDAGSPRALVLMALVVYGATAIGWNGVFLAAVARLAPPGQAGVATGGTLAFTYLGVVVGPPLFGVVASVSSDYGLAFAATAAPLALCLLALRPARSTPEEKAGLA